jgi:peptidoglycan/xylan/chitin deacetylase (PgdA/CDA1 family)
MYYKNRIDNNFLKVFLYVLSFLTLLTVLLLLPNDANGTEFDGKAKVKLDGKKINYDVSPVIKNKEILVPVKKTAKSFGISVHYNKKSKTIKTTGNGIKTKLVIGNKIAYKNRKPVSLNEPPTIYKDQVLIPLPFIAKAYGYKFSWDNKNKTALLFSSKDKKLKYKTAYKKIPVLMYHILIKGRNDSISVDPARFKEHMEALKNAGYSTITVFDLLNYFEKGTNLPEKPILITFDDGYISNYTEAYPILKELAMKATIFIIASRIFEERTIIENEYEKFTWKQAREMSGTMTIQSHTWDSHRQVKSITGENRGMIARPLYLNGKPETQEEYEKRVLEDLVRSKNIIKEKMGYDSVSLAYPYGDYSADTIKLVEKAGYKMAFTTIEGLVTSKDNRFELNRITGNGAYSGKELVRTIESYQ